MTIEHGHYTVNNKEEFDWLMEQLEAQGTMWVGDESATEWSPVGKAFWEGYPFTIEVGDVLYWSWNVDEDNQVVADLLPGEEVPGFIYNWIRDYKETRPHDTILDVGNEFYQCDLSPQEVDAWVEQNEDLFIEAFLKFPNVPVKKREYFVEVGGSVVWQLGSDKRYGIGATTQYTATQTWKYYFDKEKADALAVVYGGTVKEKA